jgi:hypothetical protein
MWERSRKKQEINIYIIQQPLPAVGEERAHAHMMYSELKHIDRF